MATVSNIRPLWDTNRSVGSEPLLESIPFPAALIDRGGVVRAANTDWLSMPGADGPGQTYLHFCQRMASACGDAMTALPGGIRNVLAGRQADFTVDYPINGEPTRLLRIS